MDLRGGETKVCVDVPAAVRGGLPPEAKPSEGESGGVSRQPADVEGAVGEDGDPLDERTGHPGGQRALSQAVQRTVEGQ